ncbi:MAG: glycosyltransferase [Lachnospiraceae bacterium]|nr:glycosyltransferase [Lachnospiraceae bacterium]
MKVLWICNVPIPEAKAVMGDEAQVRVSWLVGISKALREKVDLYIAYTSCEQKEIAIGKGEKVTFVSVPRKCKTVSRFDENVEEEFVKVYQEIKPDVIHVFGTEFPHTLSVMNAGEKTGYLDHTVVSIQGLVSIYAGHYVAALPEWVQHFYTVRDILRHCNILGAKREFAVRGTYEIKALRKARHVIGRTDWDEACTKMFRPEVVYHFNNEILRDSFYQEEWQYETCEPYRIFMSQGGVPYKGFHFMIEALAILKRKYPKVKLYITERDYLHPANWRERLRLNSYQYYIKKLIKKYHLEEQIFFLDTLDEKQMCEQYLKANVFVSPSAIENSPNSLGEAMLLGTPTVVSDVGGVKNMIAHETEGYVYQHDAPYMLAYYVEKFFEMGAEAKRITDNARAHAARIFDVDKNISDLIHIYEEIECK